MLVPGNHSFLCGIYSPGLFLLSLGPGPLQRCLRSRSLVPAQLCGARSLRMPRAWCCHRCCGFCWALCSFWSHSSLPRNEPLQLDTTVNKGSSLLRPPLSGQVAVALSALTRDICGDSPFLRVSITVGG